MTAPDPALLRAVNGSPAETVTAAIETRPTVTTPRAAVDRTNTRTALAGDANAAPSAVEIAVPSRVLAAVATLENTNESSMTGR